MNATYLHVAFQKSDAVDIFQQMISRTNRREFFAVFIVLSSYYVETSCAGKADEYTVPVGLVTPSPLIGEGVNRLGSMGHTE